MDVAKLVLQYFQTAIWPITVLVLAWFFRDRLSGLVDRLEGFSAFGANVQFAKRVAQAQPAVQVAQQTAKEAQRERGLFKALAEPCQPVPAPREEPARPAADSGGGPKPPAPPGPPVTAGPAATVATALDVRACATKALADLPYDLGALAGSPEQNVLRAWSVLERAVTVVTGSFELAAHAADAANTAEAELADRLAATTGTDRWRTVLEAVGALRPAVAGIADQPSPGVFEARRSAARLQPDSALQFVSSAERTLRALRAVVESLADPS